MICVFDKYFMETPGAGTRHLLIVYKKILFKMLSNKQTKQNLVQIEIEVEKLELLFSKGDLCAVDLRPLNSESKISLWNLCLSSCVKNIQCRVMRIDSPQPYVRKVDLGY